MSDHYQAALNKNSHATHIFETHNENSYVSVNGWNYKESQHHHQNSKDETIVINTSTNVPSTVFSGGTGQFVDIFIDNEKIHTLKEVYLEFDITNHVAIPVIPNPSQFFIDRFENFIGENSLGTTNAISAFVVDTSMMNYDEISSVSAAYNIDPDTYGTTASIAQDATQKFRVNITGNLRGMGIFVPGTTGCGKKIKITVYFNPATVWAVSGGTDIIASNFRVLVEHSKLNKKNYDQEMMMYKSAGVRLKYIDYRHTKHASIEVAASENNQRISNISGLSTQLFILSRPQNAADADTLTLRSIDSLYLTDGSTNISGGSALSGEYLQFLSHKKLPSRLCSTLDIYHLAFCESPISTYTNVVNTGYLPLSENHVLHYTPTATSTSQIEIISVHLNSLFIQGSKIIVEKTN
jgi:hypothetical protein